MISNYLFLVSSVPGSPHLASLHVHLQVICLHSGWPPDTASVCLYSSPFFTPSLHRTPAVTTQTNTPSRSSLPEPGLIFSAPDASSAPTCHSKWHKQPDSVSAETPQCSHTPKHVGGPAQSISTAGHGQATSSSRATQSQAVVKGNKPAAPSEAPLSPTQTEQHPKHQSNAGQTTATVAGPTSPAPAHKAELHANGRHQHWWVLQRFSSFLEEREDSC